MRRDMGTTWQAALMDGRLLGVLSSVTEKRKQLDQAKVSGVSAEASVIPEQEKATPRPLKPTSAKTCVRPRRRSSHLSTESLDVATPKLTVASMPKASKLSRPTSPAGALPPVTPPCRKALGSRPFSRSMSLDLCVGHQNSLQPSATIFNLGADLHPALTRNPTASGQTAMSLDLCFDHKMPLQPISDVALERKPTASSQKLSKPPLSPLKAATVRTSTLEQVPSFLPSVSGSKISGGFERKSSASKRSCSMDSFVWGVAPVRSHLEWSCGQAVH